MMIDLVQYARLFASATATTIQVSGADRLPADVAKTYDIARSKNRAMLNVAVTRRSSSVGLNTSTLSSVG